MRYLLLFLLPTLFLITSCEDGVDEPDEIFNYLPLEVGNYWVYETYDFSYTTGQYSRIGTDSAYVSGDTTVNSKKYYKLCGFVSSSVVNCTFWNYENGELSGINGELIASSSKLNQFLNRRTVQATNTDTLAEIVNRMEGITTKQVPAGEFSTIERNEILTYSDVNQVPADKPNPYVAEYHYAAGVGPIFYQFTYFNQPGFIERRLVRYKVN